MTSVWPGIVLTFAASASFFDAILSPIAAIDSCFGPMNTMPAASRSRLNAWFSDRKP